MKIKGIIKNVIGASLALLTVTAMLVGCTSGATTRDYDYKTDIKGVESVLNSHDKKFLVLVNKKNTVGSDYEPDALADVDTEYTNGGKSVQLQKSVARAAEALIKEMRSCGITNVSVTSGYRTYAYQQTLFNRYFEEEKAAHPSWSDAQIREEVLSYSAAPGSSEHQTGLCVDLITTEMEGLWNYGSETPSNPYDKGFAETAAFDWLQDNAHKFGFILRYPEDKTGVTGYSYESWHYRFVGVAAATEIYEKGITLEEYLGK